MRMTALFRRAFSGVTGDLIELAVEGLPQRLDRGRTAAGIEGLVAVARAAVAALELGLGVAGGQVESLVRHVARAVTDAVARVGEGGQSNVEAAGYERGDSVQRVLGSRPAGGVVGVGVEGEVHRPGGVEDEVEVGLEPRGARRGAAAGVAGRHPEVWVANVAHAVVVDVILGIVGRPGAVVADVADGVAVGVSLGAIAHLGAVVVDVLDAVTVLCRRDCRR